MTTLWSSTQLLSQEEGKFQQHLQKLQESAIGASQKIDVYTLGRIHKSVVSYCEAANLKVTYDGVLAEPDPITVFKKTIGSNSVGWTVSEGIPIRPDTMWCTVVIGDCNVGNAGHLITVDNRQFYLHFEFGLHGQETLGKTFKSSDITIDTHVKLMAESIRKDLR
ncbi:MAG: hypothetical protein HUJ26_21280 [Planctomycetaceae bacterium]|nr:hypothetical protein [Planctomycetaceae bacterium]